MKGHSIEYRDRGTHLRARVSGGGTATTETVLEYWAEIAAEARRRHHVHILVIHALPEILPLPDVFRIASELPGSIAGLRVAFVDECPDHLPENRFMENVAAGRGAVWKVFGDEDDAIRWFDAGR